MAGIDWREATFFLTQYVMPAKRFFIPAIRTPI